MICNYVTYIVKYSGNLLPVYYIGSTSAKKALSGDYFGSIKSKKYGDTFRRELKNNKHLFELEILSAHPDRKSAIDEELKIQKERDVVKSDLYMNESYAVPNGFFGMDVSGSNNPLYGKQHSAEAKLKMSKAKKGKSYIDQHGEKKAKLLKDNLSCLFKGDNNPGHKYGPFNVGKFGELHPMFGKTHTQEAKNKISEASSRTHKGKILSDSTKKKLSELNSGNKNPHYKEINKEELLSKLSSSLNIKDVCNIFSISATTLNLKCKEFFNQTPGKFLKNG